MRETNPPSNPELLDALAKRISCTSGYDLKALIRDIAQSHDLSAQRGAERAQRKSTGKSSRASIPKRLRAEVLFDSVNQITGTRNQISTACPPARAPSRCPTTASTPALISSPSLAGPRAVERLRVRAHAGGEPRSARACTCSTRRTFRKNSPSRRHQPAASRSSPLESARRRGGHCAGLYLYRDGLRARSAVAEELEGGHGRISRRRPRNAPDGTPLDEDQGKVAKPTRTSLWALLNTKEFLFNH